MKIYVALQAGRRFVVRCHETPTPYMGGPAAMIGPFRTVRGARWAASPAAIGNPHFQTVADAERIARTPVSF